MFLKIQKIILYPKNRDLTPRVIKFEENKINVITGYSHRGKSAIIHIIDFCLGSDDCNVPIGKIRDLVDKFAIIANLGDKCIFIGRDNPDNLSKTTVMYYELFDREENMTFSLEKWIEDADKFKSNRDQIKRYLGELSGLKNIAEKDHDKTLSGFDAPASFRDMSAFQFQPQNIIANPTTIFYNTDSFEHLKRLKTLFPLVLGYKSYEMLQLEREIDILDKDERDKQSKLDDIKRQYENWQADIYQYYTKAIGLGLTKADIDIKTAKVDMIKEELVSVSKSIEQNDFFKEGSSFRYSERLESLDAERIVLVRMLDLAKVDLLKIEKFDKAKEEYIQDVAGEIDIRLRPVDWFLEQKGTNICPFCESYTDKAVDELLFLKEEQLTNKIILQESNSRAFSFEKEKADLRNRIGQLEKEIKQYENNIQILIKEDEAKYKQFQDVYEFAGKLKHVIENLDKISPSGDLAIELEQLKKKIAEKRVQLNKLREKFDKQACLNRVTMAISNYIKLLPIEDRESRKVHLDPDQSVSIKIEDTVNQTMAYLSKLGSGANHMCYHLATLLGLHEYFLKLPGSRKVNYIPSFLVLDQPSQVYFPEKFPDTQTVNTLGTKEKRKISEDISNTTAIFQTCSQFCVKNDFKTQIIILEHAPESTWKDVEHIHLVEEWRGHLDDKEDIAFNALIQSDWLQNEISD